MISYFSSPNNRKYWLCYLTLKLSINHNELVKYLPLLFKLVLFSNSYIIIVIIIIIIFMINYDYYYFIFFHIC